MKNPRDFSLVKPFVKRQNPLFLKLSEIVKEKEHSNRQILSIHEKALSKTFCRKKLTLAFRHLAIPHLQKPPKVVKTTNQALDCYPYTIASCIYQRYCCYYRLLLSLRVGSSPSCSIVKLPCRYRLRRGILCCKEEQAQLL